jgi:ABC-type phosphate transport system permease subunit
MAVDAARNSLKLSPRTKRRKLVNLLMQALATIAALAAVAVLALVVVSVAQRGASALSWGFFTKTAATFGQGGGGVANALVGSIVIVALATAMAVPVGILIALYVAEFAPPRVADLTEARARRSEWVARRSSSAFSSTACSSSAAAKPPGRGRLRSRSSCFP